MAKSLIYAAVFRVCHDGTKYSGYGHYGLVFNTSFQRPDPRVLPENGSQPKPLYISDLSLFDF